MAWVLFASWFSSVIRVRIELATILSCHRPLWQPNAFNIGHLRPELQNKRRARHYPGGPRWNIRGIRSPTEWANIYSYTYRYAE